MEPHEDQWAYLSTLGRMTPREVASRGRPGWAGRRRRGGEPARAASLDQDQRPGSAPVIHARLGAGDPVEQRRADTGAAGHAQARRVDAEPAVLRAAAAPGSTWDTPRFLRSFDETLDGGLILPRGLSDKVDLAGRSRPAAAWR